MGNLTRNPELRYTPKGTACTDIGIAINRRWKDESGAVREEVTFVDVTFWGRQAEVVCKYLEKGSPLYVEGRLTVETWDDKQTGQKRSRMKVVGEALEFLGGGNGGNGGNGGGRAGQEQAPRAQMPARGQQPAGVPSGAEDDIPFD